MGLVVAPLSWGQSIASGQLINLSVRRHLAAGETLIVGFVVAGNTPVRLLLRGIGPSLTAFGVRDAMANPKLVLTNQSGFTTLAVSNDDWGNPLPPVAGPGVTVLPTDMEGAFPLEAGSHDAALLVELNPGPYTFTVSSTSPTEAGTVLAEVYNTQPSSDLAGGRLINLSALGGTSANSPMLGGFVVAGDAFSRVLVRVAGPALSKFGVAGAAIDPRLDLMNQQGTILLSNDNWDAASATETVDSSVAASQAGAVPFASGSRDAAAVAALPAGAYTLAGSGVNGTSGVVLIEIYELKP